MQNLTKEQHRHFLKDTIPKTINFAQTAQSRGIAPPPLEKPFNAEAERIDLISPDKFGDIKTVNILSAIENRRSRRQFSDDGLTIEELSFFGVRSYLCAPTM